jgi:hypothetical protein
MSREKELRLINAEIALCEAEIKPLQAEVDREWSMRFAVVFGQKLYLRGNYAECRACKERLMVPEACLESRLKTGKCILEVGTEQLKRLDWDAEEKKGAIVGSGNLVWDFSPC